MKKKFTKSLLILILICTFFLSGCSKKTNDEELNKIQNLTESPKEIPDCIFFIKGVYDYIITKDDLKNLNMYNFTVKTKNEKNKIETNTYAGIRLKDVLKEKTIDKYETLNMRGDNVITIFNNQVSDDIYLIFYKNDKLVTETSETSIMLYARVDNKNYEIPGLYRIEII